MTDEHWLKVNGCIGMSDMSDYVTLEQLPLNIIFGILTYLSLQDLQNVAQTCKLLRVLCNESIAYGKYSKDSSVRTSRTRRLMQDFLSICDDRRKIIRTLTNYNLTITEALGYIQTRMDLGSFDLAYSGSDGDEQTYWKAKPHNTDAFKSTTSPPDGADIVEDLRCPHSGLDESTQRQGFECDSELSVEPGDQDDEVPYLERSPMRVYTPQLPHSVVPTTFRKRAASDYDGLTYLKILKGAYTMVITSPINTRSLQSKDNTDIDRTPTRSRIQHHQIDTVSGKNYVTPNSGSSNHHRLSPEALSFHVSPHSSHGDSGSSIFSDTPRLSDAMNARSWTMGYELDHVFDGHSGDSDSTNPTEYIKQLQNSVKVKDKAVLFEKLLTESAQRAKIKRVNGTLFLESKRDISRCYLEELERCNSNAPLVSPDDAISNANDEVWDKIAHTAVQEGWNKMKRVERKYSNSVNSRSTPQRRTQLKAFVTNDNRICYERL
ncbi:Mfb1p Ecym_4137 [Eremothecium cymbalariae DBVPG|uniref:F-box domain-containing protein n=1 Tax=Eremothecium cymbalariae (strain CBS 270.75 / DBVPG 7215 / KCTC 17166 / NRRL Y-17582) TaxID=931890 RepID=G8JT63_ERECY|nr:hypothetical protein Ecym_4137 [Eremothecium cymbalariae DBVPG\